jgi:hypothetical protein
VHPNSRHRAVDCREIIKLARRVSEQHEQSSKDVSPPHRRPGQKEADEEAAAVEGQDLGYQSPEGDLKDVFTGDSDSSDGGDRRKKLYVMYGGSWELISRKSVKSLRREVLSAVPGSPKLLHTNGGGAPPSPSGHPTAPTTWREPAYCHSSPPLLSPTCGYITC